VARTDAAACRRVLCYVSGRPAPPDIALIDSLLSPFYAATISMGPDGGLLIASSHERVLAWGIVFCTVAAIALIFWLCRVQRTLALSIVGIALLIPILIMPSVRHEFIYVRKDRVTIETGNWFMPSRSVIDLAKLRRIRDEGHEYYLGNYYVEPNAVWHMDWSDGRQVELRLNGFFTAHRMAVAQYLRDRGMWVEPPIVSREVRGHGFF
jgi:hypothetical protein